MSGAPGAAEPQPDARRLNELVPALLDFEKRPGRYRLALREPGILFEQPHAVLLLAAGRAVKGLTPLKPGPQANAVQQAARYFVRAAMLRPNADHYTLLGLTPGFDPQTLRDHYRLMIRLTHPDFAASGEAWPADAASRINIAHDVLALLPSLERNMPSTMRLNVMYDSTVAINESIHEVIKTILEAAAIVLVVITLFLGSFRAVIIPIITIPLSLIGVVMISYAVNGRPGAFNFDTLPDVFAKVIGRYFG